MSFRVRRFVVLLLAAGAMTSAEPAFAGGPLADVRAGIAAREIGHWAEAVALFRAAVAAAPTWASARLELAQALLRTGGDPDEVGRHLQRARRVDPDNPRLHYLTGLLLEETGQPDQAAAAYEQALDLRPSLLDARLRLGRLLLREGRVDEAAENLERVVRDDGGNLAARVSLAEAYEKAGALDRAEAQLKTIVALHPEGAFHVQRLVRFYERTGQPQKAEETQASADAASGRGRRTLRPLPKSRR